VHNSNCPDILSYLQSVVDADGRMGLYVLTGSQQFGLMSGITQSLAGRTAFVELLPFSLGELSQFRATLRRAHRAVAQFFRSCHRMRHYPQYGKTITRDSFSGYSNYNAQKHRNLCIVGKKC